jgi:Sulfotransferase family
VVHSNHAYVSSYRAKHTAFPPLPVQRIVPQNSNVLFINQPPASKSQSRSRAPVFIIGCPRSGTTLLYDFLITGGNFADYRAESSVFSVLGPAFGDLRNARNRRRLLDRWLRSRLFDVSGLEADRMHMLMMSACQSEGDFLRLHMEQIALQQGRARWAEKTPDHALYLSRIDREIPGSLFIHIIRDGRDVALSYSRLGWIRGNDQNRLLVAGMYWKWIVDRARRDSSTLGDRYIEVRFEDLVARPCETLSYIGQFIGEKLDYDEILKLGVGCMKRPNSSFLDEFDAGAFNPVGRWKKVLSGAQIERFEALLGDYLEKLGYPVSDPSKMKQPSRRMQLTGSTHKLILDTKHWLKSNTALGRLVDLDRMESA